MWLDYPYQAGDKIGFDSLELKISIDLIDKDVKFDEI